VKLCCDMSSFIPVKQKISRGKDSKLKVLVVGAGLGGLGAAIAILLAGHDVLILESTSEIAEVSLFLLCPMPPKSQWIGGSGNPNPPQR